MTTEYYTASGVPSQGAHGDSAAMRGEMVNVEAGFAKLPTLAGNASLPIFVNGGATALEAVSAATARTRLGIVIGTDVQPLDADLTAIAALASAADRLPYATGAQAWALTPFTAAARALLADASASSSLIGFTQAGAGASARTVQAKAREIVSITDFGGVGDGGVTDNGAALQRAHDALGSDGGVIVIPPTSSYYGVSTTAAFTKPVRLVGEGWYCSELLTSTNGLTMITTTKQLQVENIGFTASGAAIGTAIAIKTLAAATNHNRTLLRNCYMAGFLRSYWSERTTELYVIGCKIAADGYGIYLENATSSDEGDSFISDCTFSATAGDTSIHVASTAGLNISNCKFFGTGAVHVDIAPTTHAVGNFLITNSSFEGHTTAGIRLIATTGAITKTVIHGNQFSGDNATHVIVGKFAKNTVITGNSFNDLLAANGRAVDIQAEAAGVTIVGNSFHQILTAINSDASITGQEIRGNRCTLLSAGTTNVTNYYLGGEDDTNLSGPNSTKELEWDRFIANASNAVYVNAFQFRGNCVAEIEVTGVVQGAGNAHKYKKVLVDGTTVTDLIALVSTGSTFDLQVTASGGFVVVGIKRNGATGVNLTAMVRVKLTGYGRDFSKV